MSRLTIYPDNSASRALLDTTDGAQIAASLEPIRVRFERWSASRELPANIDDAAVMEAYRVELRKKFLDEHTHDEDEVRFFVEGAGVFYLRAAGKVHMTLCERGDLISVPAGTRHWFDMGPAPHFTAIRLFTNPEGWVAQFTGDPIAQKYPSFEQVAA